MSDGIISNDARLQAAGLSFKEIKTAAAELEKDLIQSVPPSNTQITNAITGVTPGSYTFRTKHGTWSGTTLSTTGTTIAGATITMHKPEDDPEFRKEAHDLYLELCRDETVSISDKLQLQKRISHAFMQYTPLTALKWILHKQAVDYEEHRDIRNRATRISLV
jgi:hypothetical protein